MSICKIRSLDKEDMASITLLWEGLLTSVWTEEMIETSLNLPTALAYGAFFQGSGNLSHLVGFILGNMVQEEAEIYAIAVEEAYQGRKIGETLLRKFEQQCFLYKGRSIFLEVAESNKKAQNFYLSQGYSLITKRSNYYPNKESAWVFCKKKVT